MRHDELAESGRYAEAADALAPLIDALPPDRHRTRGMNRLKLAHYLEQDGRGVEAQALWQRVIDDPDCEGWIKVSARKAMEAHSG